MTTLLLLGGSRQQVVAIDTAKRLGFQTVLCDYLPNNPGQYHADKFYLISTTDKDAVLEVARKEQIDGIVAYASDPAAPTAAYVSEVLNLPGLPYESTMNFCEKHRFREFLKSNGFNVPRSMQIDRGERIDKQKLSSMQFPLIVKPTDSSGSKGVTVVRKECDLVEALEYASEYSRNGVLIVEEFVERAHPHVIEAELTVSESDVVVWGLINSIRDDLSNPLLPAAYSFPLEITPEQKKQVIKEVTALVKASGMQSGAFNVEMIIDSNNRLFFLDAGPRNGGNMLPDFISMICGGNIIEAAVQIAVGHAPSESVQLNSDASQCWGMVVLHSSKDCIFHSLEYSDFAKQRLVKEVILAKPGDEIKAFLTCRAAFGFVFLRFESEEEKRMIMNHLDDHIKVV